jgi:hypothetical protein
MANANAKTAMIKHMRASILINGLRWKAEMYSTSNAKKIETMRSRAAAPRSWLQTNLLYVERPELRSR